MRAMAALMRVWTEQAASIRIGRAQMQQGFNQNLDVELEAPVALVAEVGVDAGGHGGDVGGFAAPAFHLGQAGDAGLEGVALHVAGHVLAVVLVVLDGMGAGTHQAHVNLEHVKQLGQLIKAPAPQHRTHGGHTRIVAGGLLQAGLITGFEHEHAAELVDRKALAIEAVALLAKQHRAGAGKLHRQGDQQQQRSNQQNTGARNEQLKAAFELAVGEELAPAPEVDAGLLAHLIHSEVHRGLGPIGCIHHGHGRIAKDAQQIGHLQAVAGDVAEHNAIHGVALKPALHLAVVAAKGWQARGGARAAAAAQTRPRASSPSSGRPPPARQRRQRRGASPNTRWCGCCLIGCGDNASTYAGPHGWPATATRPLGPRGRCRAGRSWQWIWWRS